VKRPTIFSTDGVIGVKNLNTCVLGFLFYVFGLISLQFIAVFTVCNLWTGPGFIFEPCMQFLTFQ